MHHEDGAGHHVVEHYFLEVEEAVVEYVDDQINKNLGDICKQSRLKPEIFDGCKNGLEVIVIVADAQSLVLVHFTRILLDAVGQLVGEDGVDSGNESNGHHGLYYHLEVGLAREGEDHRENAEEDVQALHER